MIKYTRYFAIRRPCFVVLLYVRSVRGHSDVRDNKSIRGMVKTLLLLVEPGGVCALFTTGLIHIYTILVADGLAA